MFWCPVYILYIYRTRAIGYILISITLWPFNWYQTLLILWLRTSYRSGYIYMERNKNLKDIHYFWITKLQTFKNNFHYCSKHLPSTASYYSQNISFTEFSRERKYYRELISYEQCRLTRIISKGGLTVVSWGQRAKAICLTTLDIL